MGSESRAIVALTGDERWVRSIWIEACCDDPDRFIDLIRSDRHFITLLVFPGLDAQ